MRTGRLEVDVAVVGGGPAGAAAAAVLAEHGLSVVVLERRRFPRYSVGESLIPYCWYPLQRLGVLERLDRSSFVVPKYSVQFASADGRRSTPFYFSEHMDHPSSKTWQVVRSEFDALLLDNATERGVRVLQPCAAREFLREGGRVCGVRAEGVDGRSFDVRATLTLDASGRDALAQTLNGWRVPDRDLRKMAVWTYYRGARRDVGRDEGATTIAYLPGKAWFWYIPLPEDTVSVGVVGDKDRLFDGLKNPSEVFRREVGRQAWISERLATGTPCTRYFVTSDFSYRSRHCAEDGLLLVGDAFAFLDPVFSSGVFLALQGGVMAADAVRDAVSAGDPSAARFRAYGARFLEGMEAMRRLVHAFYDEAFSFGEFLAAHPELRGDLTDCLVGNLFRDFGPFFEAVGAFASLPSPLGHGLPADGR